MARLLTSSDRALLDLLITNLERAIAQTEAATSDHERATAYGYQTGLREAIAVMTGTHLIEVDLSNGGVIGALPALKAYV